MRLSIEELERISSEKFEIKTRKAIDILLRSINDWPITVLTLEEYINQLEILLKNTTSKINLTDALKSVSLSKRAWESESISQVLELYSIFDDQKSLRDIVADLEFEIQRNI